MRNLNLQNVTAKTGSDFPNIEPGGYICRIIMVEDVPEKEYLRVDLDVAAGEYKDYYKDLAARAGFWGCTQYWSYKEANLPYFKGNIIAVEESNQGYRFSDQSEQDLRGKLVGAVFGEEEYKNKAGEIKRNVKPRFVCSAQKIMDHDYNIPKRKIYDPAKDKRNRAAGTGDPLHHMMQNAEEEKLPWELPF